MSSGDEDERMSSEEEDEMEADSDDEPVDMEMSEGDDESEEEEEELEFEIDSPYPVASGSGSMPSRAAGRTGETFVVLGAADIVDRQRRDVMCVAERANVPLGVAATLLRHFKWNVEQCLQRYFDDEERTCAAAHVSTDVEFMRGEPGTTVLCEVCFEEYPGPEMVALSCRHFFCTGCWKQYLAAAVEAGYSCIYSTCMFPKCDKVVSDQVWADLAEPEVRAKYTNFLLRSFVEDNPYLRWCPFPDCGRAVSISSSGVRNVQCACGFEFCFQCNEEQHDPASCEMVSLWKQKESSDSSNALWLSANVKNCPKCKSPIEKNGGCMHMTCSRCRHEFCWICTEDWKRHSNETGGFYKCNRYQPKQVEERHKENLKQSLDRYLHYYTRYLSHLQAERLEAASNTEKARALMESLRQKAIGSDALATDDEIVREAVRTRTLARKTLKWTYVYAYYEQDDAKRELFEFLQEDLERAAEKLAQLFEQADKHPYNREQMQIAMRDAERRRQHIMETEPPSPLVNISGNPFAAAAGSGIR